MSEDTFEMLRLYRYLEMAAISTRLENSSNDYWLKAKESRQTQRIPPMGSRERSHVTGQHDLVT
jgi:hypothetical protein